MEDLEDGQQFLGIALAEKLIVVDFASQPVACGMLVLQRGHWPPIERSTGEVDGDHPGRRGERFNGHAAPMFPFAVGLSLIPGLEEFHRAHGFMIVKVRARLPLHFDKRWDMLL